MGLIGDHQGDDDDADGGLSPPPGFLDTLVRQNLRLLHFAQEALLLLLLGVASNMVALALALALALTLALALALALDLALTLTLILTQVFLVDGLCSWYCSGGVVSSLGLIGSVLAVGARRLLLGPDAPWALRA